MHPIWRLAAAPLQPTFCSRRIFAFRLQRRVRNGQVRAASRPFWSWTFRSRSIACTYIIHTSSTFIARLPNLCAHVCCRDLWEEYAARASRLQLSQFVDSYNLLLFRGFPVAVRIIRHRAVVKFIVERWKNIELVKAIICQTPHCTIHNMWRLSCVISNVTRLLSNSTYYIIYVSCT